MTDEDFKKLANSIGEQMYPFTCWIANQIDAAKHEAEAERDKLRAAMAEEEQDHIAARARVSELERALEKIIADDDTPTRMAIAAHIALRTSEET